jgi:hypothetical protein
VPVAEDCHPPGLDVVVGNPHQAVKLSTQVKSVVRELFRQIHTRRPGAGRLELRGYQTFPVAPDANTMCQGWILEFDGAHTARERASSITFLGTCLSGRNIGRELLRSMLAGWSDDEIGPALLAILQTAAHETTTRDKLRLIVERSLMGVSHLGVDEQDRRVRSGLVASQLMGLAMMRYVWRIEPVASMSEEQLRAVITPVLQHYIEGDLSVEADPPV